MAQNIALDPGSLGHDVGKAITDPAGLIPGISNISNPLTGITAVGDIFQRLAQPQTWIRISEVIIGVLLLAVGVASMTNSIPAATKIAAMVK
jgi:hypothetical protein